MQTTGWSALPAVKQPKTWPLRLATAVAAALALVYSFMVFTAHAAVVATAAIFGLAVLIFNIVTIRKAPGGGSKWLLLLTIPVFMWSCVVYIIFGIGFARVDPGPFTSTSGGYSLQIPAGYMGRQDLVHGALILVKGNHTPDASAISAAPGAATPSTKTTEVTIFSTKVPNALTTDAQMQAFHKAVVAEFQKDGVYLSQQFGQTASGNTVSAIVVKDTSDTHYGVAANYFFADKHAHLLINVVGAPTPAEAAAYFKQIVDSIH
jgi:hypothetical protein